jgi:(1->4)-alpha-D-glucan 1-alpha-D-glucosylmutase
MLATATHDHKRGEDARARLAVLSETPDAWASFLRRAESIAEPWIGVAGDDGALPRSDFNMLAQTIVGAWPLSLSPRDAEGLLAFQERIVGWQTKSLREAKLQTSWHVPDVAYEERWIEVVKALLAEGSAFTEFAREMVDAIAPAGAINGLAQTLLRLTAPGVPDLYQGGEFWDFSLVDPDNRRPIDFAARRAALADESRFEDLAETWTDGRIKQRLIARVLNFRKRDPELFSRGSYEPIAAVGRFRDSVVAYLRRHETRIALVVVARHSFALRPSGACLGIDPAGWADTRLDLGSLGPLRSLLDDGSIDAAGPAALSKVLRSVPVDVYVSAK